MPLELPGREGKRRVDDADGVVNSDLQGNGETNHGDEANGERIDFQDVLFITPPSAQSPPLTRPSLRALTLRRLAAHIPGNPGKTGCHGA